MKVWLARSILMALTSVMILSLPVGGLGASRPAGPVDFDAVDGYLRTEMRDLRIPGLEVVIVSGDQVVYAQGYGVADASGRAVTSQTPMVLGSVSKGFTALAVMQLVEAGNVALDAPVQRYLPWFRLSGSPPGAPADAWTLITVRHLLHHTSGIPEFAGADAWSSRYGGDDALEQQVRSFARFPLAHAPGAAFEYSNANYETLGLIVQVVSGQSYESYVQERIFRPLDMRHSYALAAQAPDSAVGYRYWFGQPLAAPGLPTPREQSPSAMLVSNAEDMGHYLIAQMNGGKYGAVQLLSAQGIAELHRPVAPTGGGYVYGMGWSVAPDGAVGHNGETPGFTSGLWIEGDWGVFVVRNIAANQREQRLDEIAPGVLRVARGEMPVQNTLDPSFRRTMIELAVLLVLQLGAVAWCVRRLRRWAQRPQSTPRGAMRVSLVVVLPLLVHLALAALLWYMGPLSNHRPFSVLFLSAPDQILLLGANVVVALSGVALHVVSAFRLWSSTKTEGYGSRATE